MSGTPFQELFLDEIHESRPDGFKVSQFVFAPYILAEDSASGVSDENRTAAQLGDVFAKMDRLLERAQATRGNVVRVTVFLRDVLERPTLNAVWEQWFPDPHDRPPHKYVPAQLPEGINVAIQVIGLIGVARTVLEIPGVQHQDPMSMGAQTGNLVTSSRLFGQTPNLDDTISLILDRAASLLEQAGGDLSDLVQATFFVGDPEIGSAVEKRWTDRWADAEDKPRFHLLETNLGGGNGFPRVEILGLIEGAS
jgi:enamine deaminase RidA (YjgF/YER057c/UK114 family)